jgi:lipopolysaccharide/colanic/teichoic acid biosynthesis glycosyltransferase
MPVLSPASRSRKKVYISFWDLFWALASPIIALYLRDADVLLREDWSAVGLYWLFSAGFAMLAFFALRIQDAIGRYFSLYEALDIIEAVLFTELMTCGVLFTLTRLDGIPRSMPLVHGALLAGGLLAARLFVRAVLSEDDEAPNYRWRQGRIILIGANRFASSFIQLLKAYSPKEMPVIAVLDSDPAMTGRALAGVQILGPPQELDTIISEFAIHGVDTDRVVIAGETDLLSPAVLHEIEQICRKRHADLSFLPRMIGVTEWNSSQIAVVSEPSAKPSFAVSSFFRVKPWIDIVGVHILTVLLFPLLAVAAALVFLDVGRPLLFWQERLGSKGRPFLMYKFRTLRAPFDSTGKHIFASRRPSAIGRFLRVTRVDELPQLLNVLFGDMSLIGPRPLLPEDQPSNAAIRLSVRPGITGWAQVKGGKLVTKEEKEKLDEWYVRNASLLVDTRIIILTLKLMLNSRMSSQESLADTEQAQNKTIDAEGNITLLRRVARERPGHERSLGVRQFYRGAGLDSVAEG